MPVRSAPKATAGTTKRGHPLAGLVQHSAGLRGVIAAQRPITGLDRPTNPKVALALRSSVTTITKERISPPSSYWSANLSSKAMSDMRRRKFNTLLGSDSVALWLMPWRRNEGPWIGRNPPYPYPSLCYPPTNQWEDAVKANYKIPVVALASVILGALAMMLSVIATALAQDTVRVRGTIERIEGSTYVVKARDGAELKVTLAESPQIAGVVKASLSDIKQGS